MLLILLICVALRSLPGYMNVFLSASHCLDPKRKPRAVCTVNLFHIAEDTASVHQWQDYIHRSMYS